ncbi:MAG: transcription antitermination protein NusB [Prevotellaceae bacterium]|nr:transcription antitermination protein NusB [Prevotellaceae bacterium]
MRTGLEKTYDLYHFLLSSVVAVADYAEERTEIGLRKFKPTEAEANPNLKFIKNKAVANLRASTTLTQYNEKHHLNWREHSDAVRQLYSAMIERDYYKEYMSSSNDTYFADLQVLDDFFTYEFEDNKTIESILEDMNTYFTDDIGFVLSAIIRTLNGFQRKRYADTILMPMYYAEDDESFAFDLLHDALKNFKHYSLIANQFIQNWESDRIAWADVILIVLGISEATAFPSIPIKVTINEYVEIAKYYSTPHSHIFINGVLDKVIQHLISDGTIKKNGRGLIEETKIKKRILKPISV